MVFHSILKSLSVIFFLFHYLKEIKINRFAYIGKLFQLELTVQNSEKSTNSNKPCFDIKSNHYFGHFGIFDKHFLDFLV